MNKNSSILTKEILKIIIPPFLAVILFAAAVFGFAIPLFEHNLMEQKKQLLSNVIQVGIDILGHYSEAASSGKITVKSAQEGAVKQIRSLRYGRDRKEYFWINDMRPVLIMHPYRQELEGENVSEFADPDGKKLFREFVATVTREGGGFVGYRWQWKDDPGRIEKKLSCVMPFRPWGWIIGTGVYLEDVELERDLLMRNFLYISGSIIGIIIFLSALIIRNSLNEAIKRRGAEEEILQYRDHLEELVHRRTAELQDAISRVKVLSGFLPICSSCKKIRDDRGYWNQIELYIREHSNAEFSHGICPDCAAKLYPGLYPGKEKKE